MTERRGPQFKARARELTQSLFASDRSTRRMGLLFFASLLGLVLVAGVAIRYSIRSHRESAALLREAELEKKRLAELADWQSAQIKIKQNSLDLGRFLVELGPNHQQADVQLVIRCNDKAVRDYVETRQVQARNAITTAFIGVKREDFLSVEGKKKLQKKLLTHLNSWLSREYPGGKVEDLFFTNLLVD